MAGYWPMLQRACFCYSGVEAWLEESLDASHAVAVLQVKGDEGMTWRGGRAPPAVHRWNRVCGEKARCQCGAYVEDRSPLTLHCGKNEEDLQDLAASGALPGPGLFL